MENIENKDTFKMTYSAKEQEEIKAIRNKYVPREEDKMQRVRTLDAKAGNKAMIAAMTLGIIGTLLLGVGMSVIMTDFGAALGEHAMPVGIAVGIIGMIPVALAYPVYNRVLKKERDKIAPEILRLTEELMK